MEAFHSFWSEPNRIRNQGEVSLPDFEQLTAVLSALEWKRHSGKILMITDTAGEAFLRQAGLLPFWSEVRTDLDGLKGEADPAAFWAAGKLYALRRMPLPCVMLDTDLIVWTPADELLGSMQDCDAVAAHPEGLNPQSYPDPTGFRFREGCGLPESWDLRLPAANTAFLFLRDAALRDVYVDEAIRFMKHVETENLNPVQSMCFMEQRILPMCAKALGKRFGFLMNPEEVFRQESLTHTWGFKQVLRMNPVARDAFCMRCVRRIHLDFPSEAERLLACRDLRDYARRYRSAKSIDQETPMTTA